MNELKRYNLEISGYVMTTKSTLAVDLVRYVGIKALRDLRIKVKGNEAP